MSDAQKLFWIRTLHTLIYIVMATSVIIVLVAGAVGLVGTFLVPPLILLTLEGVVFFGNGLKCPLTALAKQYGAEKGYAFDTFLPERVTRYTFRFFGLLLAIGLVLLALRLILEPQVAGGS